MLNKAFGPVAKVLMLALRQPTLKKSLLAKDLEEIKVDATWRKLLVEVVYGDARDALTEALAAPAVCEDTLEHFKWRVDAIISTSSLARVLKPTITMQVRTSGKAEHTFEVPMGKFHELRYEVACLLKEMETLESRSILNIAS